MYIRRKRNASGSTSIQILKKSGTTNKLVKTVGCSLLESELVELEIRARELIKQLNPQQSLDFGLSVKDKEIIDLLEASGGPVVTLVGPEMVLGKIFDEIGFNKVKHELFRDIVISRLAYPRSKLKTAEYLQYYRHKIVDVTQIYRFLDKLHQEFKPVVEQVSYEYTKSVVGKNISVVFYDMTSLYFEAEDEDDLRKIGFSKDGKFQCPQIMLGLLVAEEGLPIGYDIFEGNTFEGQTLLPTIEKIQQRYGFEKPIVIADSAMLSKANLNNLHKQDYQFIVGGRIKNESKVIQEKIIKGTKGLKDGECIVIEKDNSLRLIISYSSKRAKKDAANRERGIKRLKKKFKSGKLTKKSINNRGYNKFLVLESEVKITLDQRKIELDSRWDGLKGYITNSTLESKKVVQNYSQLWQIEKAFRISKTDLRIRPIYHRKKDRIEAHICIAFVAYTIFKELERKIRCSKHKISPQKAIELTKSIYKIEITLPDSKKSIETISKIDDLQKNLLEIFI